MASRIHKRGFTFIELIVVSTIMLVVAGRGIAQYGAYADREKLRQEAYNFQSNLRAMQTKAISGVKPTGACTKLLSYDLRTSVTGDRYTLGVSCNNAGVEEVTTLVTRELSKGVTIAPSNTSVSYYPLTRGASGDVTFTLTSPKNAYQVGVTAAGGINDYGICAATTRDTDTGTLFCTTVTNVGTSTPTSTPTATPTEGAVAVSFVGDVTVTNIKKDEATINVTTNIASTVTVRYDKNASDLKKSKADVTAATTHAVTLNNLSDKTAYYYVVDAKSSDGNSTISSPQASFKTL